MRAVASFAALLIAAACADHPAPRAAAVPAAPAPAASSPAAVPATAPTVAAAAAPPAPALAADTFQAEVKPLLMRRCTPCHAPGGRMYDRMPFDNPATIVEHQAGILRRLKDAEEHALVERWLARAR